jgi:hypothetical protein
MNARDLPSPFPRTRYTAIPVVCAVERVAIAYRR